MLKVLPAKEMAVACSDLGAADPGGGDDIIKKTPVREKKSMTTTCCCICLGLGAILALGGMLVLTVIYREELASSVMMTKGDEWWLSSLFNKDQT